MAMYQRYGFVGPRGGLATSADEAAALAAKVGFPVVLKVVSPDIIHKTDVGGVELGCDSEEKVRAAFARILAGVREKAPRARIEGITVEEMCQQGVEIVIGLNNDPQFGPTIMFGLGGVFVELLKDVSFRLLPISREDALAMIQEIEGRPILDGFRGQPPVSTEMLTDLLMRANQMGLDLGDRLDSVDLNPVVVWGSEHRVLDAKVLLKDATSLPGASTAEGREEPQTAATAVGEGRTTVSLVPTPPNTSHLDGFFKAKSVAVIGASATPRKVGNSVMDSLTRHGYTGKVYPVNPGKDEIMGLKAYPSLSAIPDPVDLVVVTVGLGMVPEIVKECAARGVHNMVINSGGGKELGGESEVLEATIRRMAGESDLRIVGCNCIGVFDTETKLDTLFQVHEQMIRPKKGPVAILVQSGTVGAAVAEVLADVGISKFVSYGNRIDVDESDLVAYLAEDPATGVILCYLEGLRDGRKFFAVAKEVAKRKPIVVFKAGRSQRAARASVSHTGFFGGSYSVSLGAFRQAGIIDVDSCEELAAAGRALAMQGRARGGRVAMISNGAGTMVQAMDLMEGTGLSMMPLAEETVAKLRKVYPSFYLVQNPVDLTGSATSQDYEVGIRALMDDPDVDIVMPWFVFQDTPLDETIVEVLGRLNEEYEKPILCGGIGGPYTQAMTEAIHARGVPVYHSVREWVTAARAVAHGAQCR